MSTYKKPLKIHGKFSDKTDLQRYTELQIHFRSALREINRRYSPFEYDVIDLPLALAI